MANDGLLVTISGAALSLLLYENVRSSGDQIGLLLGNVQIFVTKKVTDCDRQVEYVKHHINIDTVMPCSKDILLDALGRINREKLIKLIRSNDKSVVGWFRFRRHSCLQQTMKDKIMHKEFASQFVGINGALEEHFIMFLLNASTTSSKSTHKYRHLCLQYKRGTFQPVELRINNLGADAARHDGSDYKPAPENKPQESDAFTKLVNNLSINLETTSSVAVVTEIQKQADSYLSSLMSVVCKSDEEISNLQKQVNELRAKDKKKMLAKNTRQKEKANEKKASTENERIYTTAQIHDSPRSTHSEELFDYNQSPKVISVLSRNTSSPNSFSSITKNLNIERAKEHIFSKGIRNSSPDSSSSIEAIHVDNSPESTRSKEGTPKFMNKGNSDEKFNTTKRQTNSPKSAGIKSERHSFGDYGEKSHEESITCGRKEQNPRPTSFSENR